MEWSFLGKAKYRDGRVARLPFFVGVLFKPKVWFSFFRAYKESDERSKLDEMLGASKEFSSFADEIF